MQPTPSQAVALGIRENVQAISNCNALCYSATPQAFHYRKLIGRVVHPVDAGERYSGFKMTIGGRPFHRAHKWRGFTDKF